MGSSARKKKEKKKDFQKVKLKVGKTKPKADNFTDTSFKAKSIVVNQQSLTTEAPSTIAHLHHYLSLASSSRSDTQRRDALSFLSSQLSSKPVNEAFGLPTTVLLPKLAPLILDGSSSVRTQLIKFLQLLPRNDIGHLSEKVLLYVRAGMTHLAVDIQTDSLAVLEWLLEVADEDVVSCPGGWVKTLKCFMSMMGWASSKTTTTWTTAPKATFGKVGKSFPRQLLVLSQFLRAGLVESNKVIEIIPRQSNFPLTDSNAHMLPRISNPYAYLNLFGAPRDEEGEMYVDRPGRQRVFHQLFEDSVRKGIDSAVKAAGEAGRAAGVLTKVLKAGMEDFEGVDDDTL